MMPKLAKRTGRGHGDIFPVPRLGLAHAMHLDGLGDVHRAAGKILCLLAQNGTLVGVAGRVMRLLLDDNRALHIGMELTKVVECPGLVERLRERFPWFDGA